MASILWRGAAGVPKGMADGTSMANGAKGAAAVQDMPRGPRRVVQDRRMSCKVVMGGGGGGEERMWKGGVGRRKPRE